MLDHPGSVATRGGSDQVRADLSTSFGDGVATDAVLLAEVAAPPDIKNDKHVFLRLKSNGKMLRAKAWNFAERATEFGPGELIDVAFQFEDDSYSAARGYAPWQTILRDVR